ncbi:HAMP domain-containing histidine kinase [Streptomyces kunmingensis]|uniref:histidine kinase n=1 Tax=Streptomyces kunmingensis TaxID=68225 RepID=A0ABU6CI34_9ACTN|nr:HAMP domain-containing sensor histidine kinase [Streptomyces kunmingensis]MEB3964389.1 HAMP domain-containing histidine kinase [Streptomyces kunmingensis]
MRRRRTDGDHRTSPRTGRPPLRKSLRGRLLGVSVLVATCSVAATAWLAVQTTSGAIKQEQGQNLADDTRIYDTLLGYAATHSRWDGVDATVHELARTTGRHITLTTQARRPLADSAGHTPAATLPAQASATVDPLSVDTALAAGRTGTSDAAADRIDARAVGPFRLPAAERSQLRALAERHRSCLRTDGVAADVVVGPSGRPRVETVGSGADASGAVKCTTDALDRPTTTERKALTALTRLTNSCLERQSHYRVDLALDLTWQQGARPAAQDKATEAARDAAPAPVPAVTGVEGDRTVASCVGTARREQLTSYVAAPVLLFIGDQGGTTVPGFDLSPLNTAKIAGVAALVLALTVGASVLAGTRLVRPLYALTGAAQRMKDGRETQPVPVTTDNEIGRLAAAFNDMSAHRTRLEEQRKAMVSDVAHELRTPLSTIRGWLEAAQDGVAEPDPAFIDSLLEEAVQLQHLIDDLQDLAAADADTLRLHPRPVRVEELLGQVAAAHHVRAETVGVTLSVAQPAAPVPELAADPVRLRQAVANLVSNAIRHTGPDGTVTLRAYATDPGDEVIVEVADTGSGISAADLPYVFDRFWRAEKSRNRRTGGSGLGLSIVRKLAQAHGGSATAASTEGEGSVFTLRLPLAGPAAADRP